LIRLFCGFDYPAGGSIDGGGNTTGLGVKGIARHGVLLVRGRYSTLLIAPLYVLAKRTANFALGLSRWGGDRATMRI